MEPLTRFNSNNLCVKKGHTEFIYINRHIILCKQCSQQSIIEGGILVKSDPLNFSKDIKESIYSWMNDENIGVKLMHSREETLNFLKEDFTKLVFEKYFPERLDNRNYCQDCGDLFYHKNRCGCDNSY